ncbi:MAG: threonine synthase, partial [Bacteroidota bacterium]
MEFISTSGQSPQVSFRDAVLGNLPADGGLYFPSEIPKLNQTFLEEIPETSLEAIALHVLNHFCENDIEYTALE